MTIMAINLAEAMYFDEEYGRAMPPSPTKHAERDDDASKILHSCNI
jgi:hypothetical protein